MSPVAFDASVAAVLQSGQWQCSAASTAWLLDALGQPTGQDDVVAELGPGNIDPSVGLHDATGSALAALLGGHGIGATNGPVSFDDAMAQAGTGPFLLGGVGWDHWTGVRGTDGGVLLLANPSPGWKGVGDQLSRGQFDALGPFYAVWPTDEVPAGSGPASAPSVLTPTGPPDAPAPVPWWVWAAGAAAIVWALEG